MSTEIQTLIEELDIEFDFHTLEDRAKVNMEKIREALRRIAEIISDHNDEVDANFAALPLNPHGGICINENVALTTIVSSGVANKVQVTVFDTNLPSLNLSPDHTNNHLGIDVAGVYDLHCSITALSVGGGGFKMGFELWKNNGATFLTGASKHRNLAGGGGDAGAIHVHTQVALSVGDTIEFWVYNVAGTQDIIVEDCVLTATMVEKS